MRTVAVIPARYESSRMRGKPLADLCGRPMLWWVYRRVREARNIDEVYAAVDHEAIRRACAQHGIPCVMTSPEHRTGTERLYEAARRIPADVYVCVNGDEPLIDPAVVEQVVPRETAGFFAANLRFVENRKKLRMIAVESASLSVDTPKDLEHVREILRGKLESGEITL